MELEHTSDYYTGEYLLEKLGILPCDLINGIRRQIVPYPTSEVDGTFRTPESDPALYDPALNPSPEAWLNNVKTAKFFKPFVQTSMPKIQAELLTAWEKGDDEIIDSAEKLKRAMRESLDIEVSQAEAETAFSQMRAFEKFALMSGKEYAAVAKAKWAVDLLSSSVRFHDQTPTRQPDYVSGLRTPGGEEQTNFRPATEEIPDSPAEYVQQLKNKKLDHGEIKYRLYHNGKKSWKLSWWKVQCIVEELPYPKPGAYERIKYKDDCLRDVNAWLKLLETPKTPNSTPKTPNP